MGDTEEKPETHTSRIGRLHTMFNDLQARQSGYQVKNLPPAAVQSTTRRFTGFGGIKKAMVKKDPPVSDPPAEEQLPPPPPGLDGSCGANPRPCAGHLDLNRASGDGGQGLNNTSGSDAKKHAPFSRSPPHPSLLLLPPSFLPLPPPGLVYPVVTPAVSFAPPPGLFGPPPGLVPPPPPMFYQTMMPPPPPGYRPFSPPAYPTPIKRPRNESYKILLQPRERGSSTTLELPPKFGREHARDEDSGFTESVEPPSEALPASAQESEDSSSPSIPSVRSNAVRLLDGSIASSEASEELVTNFEVPFFDNGAAEDRWTDESDIENTIATEYSTRSGIPKPFPEFAEPLPDIRKEGFLSAVDAPPNTPVAPDDINEQPQKSPISDPFSNPVDEEKLLEEFNESFAQMNIGDRRRSSSPVAIREHSLASLDNISPIEKLPPTSRDTTPPFSPSAPEPDEEIPPVAPPPVFVAAPVCSAPIEPLPVAAAPARVAEAPRPLSPSPKSILKASKPVPVIPFDSDNIPEYVRRRFSAPSIPVAPLSDSDQVELVKKAVALMTSSPLCKDGKEFEEHEHDILRLIKKYLREPLESIAEVSLLPPEIISLVDTCPSLFSLECHRLDDMNVRLRCEPTHEMIAEKSVRQANECDLEWLKSAELIMHLARRGYICVAPIYFIPPRAVLFSAFWGNDNGERFSNIQEIIRPFIDNLQPATRITPGMPCIVREGDEYARAVVIDKSPDDRFLIAFLDIYETVALDASHIFELPVELDVHHIKSSLFLGRLRGVKTVPFESQEMVTDYIDTQRADKCIAGVLIPAKKENQLCTVDLVISGTRAWLSDELTENFHVDVEPEDEGDLDAVEVNDMVVGYYRSGAYAYHPDYEKFGVEIPFGGVEAEEVKKEASSEEFLLHEDDVPVLDFTAEAKLESAAPVQNYKPVPTIRHAPDSKFGGLHFAEHLKNHAIFVEALLSMPEASGVTKRCVVYDALSHATFLKANFINGNSAEELEVIDGLIARLKDALK